MTHRGHGLTDETGRPGQVLAVDVDGDTLDRTATALARHAPAVGLQSTTDPEGALSSLATADCLLLVADRDSDLAFVHTVRDREPTVPVVLLVDTEDESTIDAVLSAGVTDVVGRDDPDRLLVARLTTALAHRGGAPDASTRDDEGLDDLKRRALEETDIGVVIAEATADTPTVFANEGFGRLTGYEPEWFVGRNCRTLQGPDTDDRPVQSIRQALSEANPVSVVLRNYRKDGTDFWNEVDITPVSDDDGTVTHYLGFQRDVTERTALQRELEAAQRALRGLYRVTTDASLSLEERIERTLTLACERLDVGLGFVTRIADDTQRIVHGVGDHPLLQAGEERPLSESYCRRTLDTEGLLAVVHAADDEDWADDPGYERFGLECYLGGKISVDGDRYGTLCFGDVEPRAEPFTEAQAAFVELLTRWVSYELERQQRERDLQLATRRFRSLFDNPRTFAGILDPDGTLREANDPALATLENPPAALDQPFWDAPWWTPDEESVQTVREAVETAANGRTASFECPYFHTDDAGTVSATIYPVYARSDDDHEVTATHELTGDATGTGTVVSLMAVGTDTTERTEQAAQLQRQRDRLEEFAAVVSHDLRSPLEVARGRLHLYEQTGEADNIDQAKDSLDRMSALIDDLLALARQGEVVSDPVPVDVVSVARRAWSSVETSIATLTVDLDSELTVDADPSRLQQLFENLFRNAVEHGSTGSRSQTHENAVEHGSTSKHETDTEVNVRLVGLDGGRRGFAVEDDGPGIDPADRPLVFDRGFSTEASGTGFGLAIVQRVADAHGWTVGVSESECGGARFEACLER